jgi:hypothetical protein
MDGSTFFSGARIYAYTMDPLDEKLLRANEIFLQDLSDDDDEELAELLPALVEAGYIEKSPYGPTEFLWGFTAAGNARVEALGFD